MNKIKIAVSSCLLGNSVRYDGGHKKDEFIADILPNYFDLIPVCPEAESGLGTPRESMNLYQEKGRKPALRGVKSKTDYTHLLATYNFPKILDLKKRGIVGFILKKNSPSCGLERVKVYGPSGVPQHKGIGLFAEALMSSWPTLPLEEEGRLHDPELKENWIERVFVYHAFQQMMKEKRTASALVQFHTRHKFTLLAHSQKHYRSLGRIVSKAGVLDQKVLLSEYENLFMEAMRVIATRKNHVNVLQHMAGFLKKHLSSSEKSSLSNAVGDFSKGYVSLSVPITLLAHFSKTHQVKYLESQSYLSPHPKELALRNFISAH